MVGIQSLVISRDENTMINESSSIRCHIKTCETRNTSRHLSLLEMPPC